MDFASLVPFELIAFLRHAENWGHLMALYRLNRLLRVMKIILFLSTWEGQLHTDAMRVHATKFVVLITIVAHWQTCMWYGMACPQDVCRGQSWAGTSSRDSLDGISDDSMGSRQSRYMSALYWAIATTTSTGYGDIHPVIVTEKYFAVGCMLAGVLLFGYLFGSITSSMANNDAPHARYTQKIRAAQKNMAEGKLDPNLQARANDYFEYLWSRKNMTHGPDLMSDMPESLQAEVALSANEAMLRSSPVFGGCSDGFLRMLSLNIKAALYLPGETVLQQGHLCHTMFFTYKGTVKIKDIRGSVKHLLKPGSHFGEVPMIMGLRNTADVVADTVCDLYTLNKADLDEVLGHYADMKTKLETDAQKRIDAAHLKHRTSKLARQGGGGGGASYKPRHSLMRPAGTNQEQKRMILHDVPEKRQSATASTDASESTALDPCATRSWRKHSWRYILETYRVPFVAMMSFASVVLVAFEAAFVTATSLMIAATYTIDAVLCLDAALQLRTKWHQRRKDVPASLVAWAQICGVSAANLPLDIIFLCAGSPWIVVSRVRLNRVLRWHSVHSYLHKTDGGISSRSLLRLYTRVTVQLLVGIHIFACFWFLTSCSDPASCAFSWHKSSTDTWTSYVTTLYWAVATMSTTGYGDIHGTTSAQHLVSVFCMLVGQVLFGTALAAVAAMLGNAMKTRVDFVSRLAALQLFMRDHHVDAELCQRVTKYLEQHWVRFQGHVNFEHIEGMPQSLLAELCSAQYSDLLQIFPLFKLTVPDFTRDLSSRVKQMLVLPGEMIVHKGDIGEEMYFILKGTVEILAEDGTKVAQQLGHGDYFGEAGLLFQKPRLNSVRAITYCELLVLSKENLQLGALHYPSISQLIRQVSEDEDHYEAIKGAVALNEAIALEPQLTYSRTLNGTFVRASNRQRTRRARVSPSEHLALPLEDAGAADLSCQSVLGTFVALCCSRLLPYSLLPGSKFASSWEAVVMLFSTVTSVTVWIQAAFAFEHTGFLAFHYAVDVLFVCDMILKLHTAFVDTRGIIITDPSCTAYQYFKTTFWLDMLSIAPIEGIALAFSGNTTRMASLFRVNRCLRACRVFVYIQYLEQSITRSTGKLELVKFTFVTAVVTNMVGCVWFMIGCFENCDSGGWTYAENGTVADMPSSGQYLTSIYWATATLASVGYGDIYARTKAEMGFAAVVMLLGFFMYGYFIASITASIANADFDRSRFREKHDCLQQMLKAHNVDPDVSIRVAAHFEYLWIRNRGTQAHSLFKELDLPTSLQADLCMNVYEASIVKVPLFRDKGLGFTRLLSLVMRPSLHLKGDYIVRKGDFGQEMFFIRKGAIEVVSDDGSEVFVVMGEGEFFGEISLVFSCPRTASIRARTNCDLFVLSKQDLDHVLLSFPAISKKIKEDAEVRFTQVKARNRQCNAANDLSSQLSTSTTSSGSDVRLEFRHGVAEVCESNSMYGPVFVTVTDEIVDPEAPRTWNGAVQEDDATIIAAAGEYDAPTQISCVPPQGLEIIEVCKTAGATSEPRSVLDKTRVPSPLTQVEEQVVLPSIPISFPAKHEVHAISSADDIEDLIAKELETATAADDLATAAPAAETCSEKSVTVNKGDSIELVAVEADATAADATEHRTMTIEEEPDEQTMPSEQARSRLVAFVMFLNRPFSMLMRKCGHPVISPKSTFARAVETTFLLFALFWSFTCPYEAAFLKQGVRFSAANAALESLFWIQIGLTFHTAIIGDDGEPIGDLQQIAKAYITGGKFARDVLTALPLDTLALLLDTDQHTTRIISLLRLVRLLRLLDVNQYFATRENELQTPIVTLRILKFAIIVSTTTHLAACIWHLVGCPSGSCPDSSWIGVESSRLETVSNSSYASAAQYCDSLYWAMATMTTTGYGDFHAETDAERIFSIVAMIAGKLLYSFVLGNIASTLANADYLRVRYKEKMAAIEDTLVDRSIKTDLRNKVKKHHEHIWNVQHGLNTTDLFREMPYTLRTDVSWNMGEDLLRQVPLFQQSDSGFVAMLAMHCRPQYFLKGDCVHKEGDICREMTFVVSGYIELKSADNRVVQIKHPRSYFSEATMISGKPYTTSFYAATDIETLVLGAEDFCHVIQHFPEMKESIESKLGLKIVPRRR